MEILLSDIVWIWFMGFIVVFTFVKLESDLKNNLKIFFQVLFFALFSWFFIFFLLIKEIYNLDFFTNIKEEKTWWDFKED